MKFERLSSAMINNWTMLDIGELLEQLSPNAKCRSIEDLKRILAQPKMVLIAAFTKDAIIGIANIHFIETITRRVGIIEDVVVDKSYRGKGVGRKLIELLIKEARAKGANCVELTSNSERKEANALYESMGFRKRETNCYRLNLLFCSK